MALELWVRQEFEAAHSLEGVFPGTHQCARLHGHRYTVTLTIRSTSRRDVVVDYHELHAGLAEILAKWDHTDLRATFPKASTCENLSREILKQARRRWPSASCVEVQEQTNTGCRAT